MLRLFISVIFCAVIAFFVSLRVPELTATVCGDAAGAMIAAMVCVGCASLFLAPAKTTWLAIRRFALITLAVAYLKQRLDHDIRLSLPSKDLSDSVSIVTGGNSGTGLAISKLLVSLGSTVVFTCRSHEKCTIAAREIGDAYPTKRRLVVPMLLDLSDLESIRTFAKEFQKRFKRLDILVNNAGLLAEPGALTAQGLEQSFGTMHIGHFALTKYLLKILLKPVPDGKGLHEAARVINLSADAMFAGNFHPSIMTGSGAGDLSTEITDNCGMRGSLECCPFLACPNTNGYARAKLANAMHAYELQRRVDEFVLQQSNNGAGPSKAYRRLVTASLHPGSVATNIHGLLSSDLTALFLRSADQAAHVILHAILDDSFVPTSYIDAMRGAHDLFNFRSLHMHKHLAAFPVTRGLPFALTKESKYFFSLQSYLWSRQSVIWPLTDAAAGSLGEQEEVVDSPAMYRKDTVAARLWDVSEQIVSDWEAKRPLFHTNVSTSAGKKLRL